MTQNTVTILADIGNKPGTTHRDALTITRRVLRITCQQRDSITAERRALRRQAGKLRRFLPFTAQQVADLERQAREHRAEQLEGTRQVPRSSALSLSISAGRSIFFPSRCFGSALGNWSPMVLNHSSAFYCPHSAAVHHQATCARIAASPWHSGRWQP